MAGSLRPARSVFDVSSDEGRRRALVEAAKFARANGQLVAWDCSEQRYAIGVYHPETEQVQPLTDEEAAILLNRDPAIRRAWKKWNAASRNQGSLVVLDAEMVRRVLGSEAASDDESEGIG